MTSGPASSATAPAPPTTMAAVSRSCLSAAEQGREVRFRTGTGATLAGVALGAGRAGVVLGHQLGSDLCEWAPWPGRSPAAMWRLRVPVLLVVPGGGHGTSLLEFGDQAPRALTAVRIGITGIFVDDQDRAERFYTEVLGLQVKTSAPTGRTNAG